MKASLTVFFEDPFWVGVFERIEDGKLSDRDLAQPSKEWLDTLTEKQILAVIAWHFRRDHFSEGSWISDSVADGYMAVLVDMLLDRCS